MFLNLDKYIRTKYQENTFSEVDSEAIWNNIQSQIVPQKLWWQMPKIWIGGSLLVVFTMALIYSIGYQKSEKRSAYQVASIKSTENDNVLNGSENQESSTKSSVQVPIGIVNQESNIEAKPISNYNPRISQINEMRMLANGEMIFENNMAYLSQKNKNYYLTPANDSSTLKIITQPANGKVLIDNATGKFKYKPNQDFYGTDSFKYVLVMPNGTESNVATIRVNIERPDKRLVDTTAAAPPQYSIPDTITLAENINIRSQSSDEIQIEVKKKLER